MAIKHRLRRLGRKAGGSRRAGSVCPIEEAIRRAATAPTLDPPPQETETGRSR